MNCDIFSNDLFILEEIGWGGMDWIVLPQDRDMW
jgi:hypothetical protein